ncbi:kynurenine/alpha-aminoadipate aminotransferase, mitochondrial-like [Homarus americanus]|uniref:kynurenine/alpha-aminoadipate aminotransferase, mitochondrial-like n=1 Tax=Homarus americanus TaxID=6706 RepID=UPI001C446980|nr:kynurenine/alpha-aminoadipate aminotransferase, mitochondrial-like [Homarus americanus]
MPNPSTFPVLEATFTLKESHRINITPQLMAQALQYSLSSGFPPFVAQLEELTEKIHAPPDVCERQVVVTVGSEHGLSMACGMLINPGDAVLFQEPTYPGLLALLDNVQAHLIPIRSDSQGVIPSLLRVALDQCTDRRAKFIYVNPSGSNPTGVLMREARRREIYSIASEYDLLILEDDPYHYIQFMEENSVSVRSREAGLRMTNRRLKYRHHEPQLLQEVPPSFLSLDTEGRVLRFDSFSKTVAPGLRVGYVTVPKPIGEKLVLDILDNILHASVLPQVILREVLKTWGHEGYLQHMRAVCELYRRQRDIMVEAVDRHLNNLCEWTVPDGGFYIWLKVLGVKDTKTLAMKRGLEKGVLVVPGAGFLADGNQPSPYIRLAYSVINPDNMDKAIKLLAEAIREEQEEYRSCKTSST